MNLLQKYVINNNLPATIKNIGIFLLTGQSLRYNAPTTIFDIWNAMVKTSEAVMLPKIIKIYIIKT